MSNPLSFDEAYKIVFAEFDDDEVYIDPSEFNRLAIRYPLHDGELVVPRTVGIQFMQDHKQDAIDVACNNAKDQLISCVMDLRDTKKYAAKAQERIIVNQGRVVKAENKYQALCRARGEPEKKQKLECDVCESV